MAGWHQDHPARLHAFAWLEDQVTTHGDILPRRLLEKGFIYQGIRVTLVAPQGIFKPRIFPQIPLSITTAPDGPYDDRFAWQETVVNARVP